MPAQARRLPLTAMALPERFPVVRPPGPRQRWANLLVVLLGLVGIIFSLFLRDQVLGATIRYSNLRAGINADFPPDWLLEEDGSDFVFRIRDTAAPDFPTTLQVSLFPVGSDSAPRNIFDALTLQRSQTLAAYSVGSAQSFLLPDGIETSALSYTYVTTAENPFLGSRPVIVEGLDVLVFERDQALVITYRASAENFGRELQHLNRFMQGLDF